MYDTYLPIVGRYLPYVSQDILTQDTYNQDIYRQDTYPRYLYLWSSGAGWVSTQLSENEFLQWPAPF